MDDDAGEIEQSDAEPAPAAPVAENRHETVVDLEELLLQPGTYFNPQTEVVVVVDDSTSVDQEIFNMEDFEGAEWVRISDEAPVDEERRDELLEDFQTQYHPGSEASGPALGAEDEDEDDDPDGPDPDPE